MNILRITIISYKGDTHALAFTIIIYTAPGLVCVRAVITGSYIRRGGAGHALHRACLCALIQWRIWTSCDRFITRFPRICKQSILVGQSKVAASSMELSVPIIQTKIKGKSNDNVNHH